MQKAFLIGYLRATAIIVFGLGSAAFMVGTLAVHSKSITISDKDIQGLPYNPEITCTAQTKIDGLKSVFYLAASGNGLDGTSMDSGTLHTKPDAKILAPGHSI